MTIKSGRIIANTRPVGLEIYLDGEPIVDSYGNIAKTPTVISNVSAGTHNVTFGKPGYDTITVMVDVEEDSDCFARAIYSQFSTKGKSVDHLKLTTVDHLLATKSVGYPMMLASLKPSTGVLAIYSFPDGVDTYVNGRYVGKSPLTVTDVPAGVATVTWKMSGMMDEEKIVDIVEGAWSQTFATMRPILPKLSYQNHSYIYQNVNEGTFLKQSESVGSITITSYPEGANIYIDGSVITDELGAPIITPATITLLQGYHPIALELDGYYTGYERIHVYPGVKQNTSTYLAKKIYDLEDFVTNTRKPGIGGYYKYGEKPERIIKHLVEKFKPTNVLDVGSGPFGSTKIFKNYNVKVWSIDADENLFDREDLKDELSTFSVIDLEKSYYTFPYRFDMVYSYEVAEHINNVDNYIETITENCGRILVMTHALPGQGGYHHVNEQNDNYWIEKVINKGFKYIYKETKEARTIEDYHFSRSGLIFERVS